MTVRLFGARLVEPWPMPSPTWTRIGFASVDDLPAPATSTDLRPYCTYVDNQVGDRCVGDGIEGGRWIAVRGKGRRASPRGIYVGARAREVTRAQGAPMPDVGCFPQDAVDTCIDVGIFPRDERDDAYDQVTALDTWSEATAKQVMLPSHFAPVGELDTLDAWLTAGFGVAVWFPVDSSWQNLSPANPTWNGLQGPVVGGHCSVAVGYPGRAETDPYYIWNSYGPTWALNGIGQIPRAVLRKAMQGGLAITGGPIL